MLPSPLGHPSGALPDNDLLPLNPCKDQTHELMPSPHPAA